MMRGGVVTRGVALEGEPLQVVHQFDVLVEAFGNADRTLERREIDLIGVGMRALQTALDLAHRRQILIDARAIGRAEPLLEPADVAAHPVEDAAVALRLALPLFRGAGAAEQAIEHHLRVVFGRQRRRRRPPRERVDVDTAVAVVAVADQVVRVGRELERGQAGVAADRRRRDLIDRSRRLHRRAFRAHRMCAAQPAGAGPRMIAAAVVEGFGLPVAEAADNHQTIAERLQRLQDLRHGEVGADPGRLPEVHRVVHRHAVGQIGESEPAGGRRRRSSRRRERGNHGVEQRQRQGRADPAQERPPRQRLFGNGPHCALRI
jgi:hypothetical protein